MSSLACIIQLKGAFQTNHHLFTEKMYLFFIFLFHQTEFVYRTSRQNVRISQSDESIRDNENRSSIKKIKKRQEKRYFNTLLLHLRLVLYLFLLSFCWYIMKQSFRELPKKKRNEQPLWWRCRQKIIMCTIQPDGTKWKRPNRQNKCRRMANKRNSTWNI